jgi:hypothetical protein
VQGREGIVCNGLQSMRMVCTRVQGGRSCAGGGEWVGVLRAEGASGVRKRWALRGCRRTHGRCVHGNLPRVARGSIP